MKLNIDTEISGLENASPLNYGYFWAFGYQISNCVGCIHFILLFQEMAELAAKAEAKAVAAQDPVPLPEVWVSGGTVDWRMVMAPFLGGRKSWEVPFSRLGGNSNISGIFTYLTYLGEMFKK